MKRFFRLSGITLSVLTALLLTTACWSINIGGIEYEKVDPGFDFTQRPPEEQNWQTPTPFATEINAGLLAYVTPDPGDYLPDRRPKVHEHVRELSAFLTPGEERAVWFAVSALESAQGLNIKVDVGDAPVKVDVRHIHFWPQRTQWRGSQWYITPELLLPCANGKRTVPTQRGVLKEEAFDIASGETAGFWLTLSASSYANAGKYTGSVTVKSRDKAALSLPLQIEILPFKIAHPKEQRWQLYADQSRWNKMSDRQILDEMKDFKRHGFNGLVELTLGSVDTTPLKTGGEPIVDVSYYKRITGLCKKAGINGPHVIYAHGLPEQVMGSLGLSVDLHKEVWPEELREGLKKVIRAYVKATEGLPKWYFYGPDEPSPNDTYAIQVYNVWGEVGVDTYATVNHPTFVEKVGKNLTSPCFVAPLFNNKKTWQEFYDTCQREGVEFTWYGTGCYVNPYPQERYLYHNRYGAGFLAWKTKTLSAVAWTLCRPHEDVFNDFDGSAVNAGEPKEQAFVYPHLLKADDWSTFQGNIPTIAWEAHREGWNDYGYIYTLQSLIDKKAQKSSPEAKEAAKIAQAKLDLIISDIPFANLMGPIVFDPAKMDRARQEIAVLIKNLRSVY